MLWERESILSLSLSLTLYWLPVLHVLSRGLAGKGLDELHRTAAAAFVSSVAQRASKKNTRTVPRGAKDKSERGHSWHLPTLYTAPSCCAIDPARIKVAVQSWLGLGMDLLASSGHHSKPASLTGQTTI